MMARDSDIGQHRARVDRFRRLHHAERPLVLPNVWDAASARVAVSAGFPAVATTSGGVAAALGYADGEQTPPDEMFAAIGRIARAVEVPVTADVESGYGLAPDELAERIGVSGAVGCNVEDTDHRAERSGGRLPLIPPDEQAGRLAAIVDASRRADRDLVVNARIDVFLQSPGSPDRRVELALERARLYLEAGADCVYPITAGEEALREFVAHCEAPVNAMARPGVARLSRLLELGVARITFGSFIQQLSMRQLGVRLEAMAAGGDDWSS